MDRDRGRAMVAVGLVGVLATGCSSSGAQPDADPTRPNPTTASTGVSAVPSPSPTSTPEDPFAMPDPVTPEYVDRVVNTIYEEWGAITREILAQPADPTAVTPVEMRERIATLFGGQYLQQRLEEADGILRGDRESLLPPSEFGQLMAESRQIKRADPSCMVVVGDYITTGTAQGGDSIIAAFSLEPSPGENRTGWRVVDVVRALDAQGNRLPDAQLLEASVDDLADVLDNTCT